MSLEPFLAFVLAASIILFLPGPTVLLVVGMVSQRGRRAIPPLAAGVVLGDLVAMSLSLMGLGALMATSATLFVLIKWCVGLYLIYLAVMQWRQAASEISNSEPDVGNASGSPGSLCRDAFLVTVFNPKSLLFFMAFMPQFLTQNAPLIPQFVLLGTLFLMLTVISVASYGLFADALFRRLRSASLMRSLKRFGAACLGLLGMATLVSRQP